MSFTIEELMNKRLTVEDKVEAKPSNNIVEEPKKEIKKETKKKVKMEKKPETDLVKRAKDYSTIALMIIGLVALTGVVIRALMFLFSIC